MKTRGAVNPWLWVPTLYFAEGIPYVIVNNVSLVMYKNLGVPNSELAFYTSLLYLPWVIKPLWSPFVDILGTKRRWIVAMQLTMTLCFAAVALSLAVSPGGFAPGAGLEGLATAPDAVQGAAGFAIGPVFVVTLVLFYVTAVASATHDIAADGFYMLALDAHRQAQFVGIRSTFYRIATVFGQGVLVMLAGVLERRAGSVSGAWSMTLLISATIFALMTVWHIRSLPSAPGDSLRSRPFRPSYSSRSSRPSSPDHVRPASSGFSDGFRALSTGFLGSVATFFRKEGVWLAVLFMLLYRLPEAFAIKMLSPFMLDSTARGGLGMDTATVGLVYGTMGVIALTVGGILGGLAAGRWGLRKMLVPMSLCLALPCAVYVVMALAQPSSLWFIGLCVSFDQLGYGFGFTAYMLYMIWFSRGRFETSHYAICTAFMALSMMLPGLVAGFLQENMGYAGFFWMVMACCIATVVVAFAAARRISPDYGIGRASTSPTGSEETDKY